MSCIFNVFIKYFSGYIERRYPDGSLQAHCSNGTVRWIKPGNYEECRFPDGTLVSINADGEQTLRFPNGQVEIHTSEYKVLVVRYLLIISIMKMNTFTKLVNIYFSIEVFIFKITSLAYYRSVLIELIFRNANFLMVLSE